MAPHNITVCPHCRKASKQILVPIKSDDTEGAADSLKPGAVFQSASQYFADDIPQAVTVEKRSFWASESVNAALTGLFAGSVVLAYGWWYDVANGPIVAGVMLAGIVGLPVLKMWWHRPGRPAAPPPEKETTIKVEHWDYENGQAILNEFDDKRITVDLLQRVAKAVMTDGNNFSRPALTKAAKISQGKYHALKDEFERLNYCYTDKGNKTHLLRQGRAFLRQVAETT